MLKICYLKIHYRNCKPPIWTSISFFVQYICLKSMKPVPITEYMLKIASFTLFLVFIISILITHL